jgi:hypothetical protein
MPKESIFLLFFSIFDDEPESADLLSSDTAQFWPAVFVPTQLLNELS